MIPPAADRPSLGRPAPAARWTGKGSAPLHWSDERPARYTPTRRLSPRGHQSTVLTITQDAHRHTSVVMGTRERVFTMEFWAARVHMASGNTADLRAAAGAIRAWQSGSPVRT